MLQDQKYTWDAGGNLTQREDLLAEETETFTYDFLDRLTSASGPYSESYAYDEIGNMTSKNGLSYIYGQNGAGPHAVTTVGETSYTYDANGNMTVRGSQTITWDVENRLVSVDNSDFVYDGNGNRVMKTEGGETILYVNKYYEKNLTTEEETTYYYHGGKLVAKYNGTEVSYIHQDYLTSTSVMTDSTGSELGTIKYFPFGATRSGSVPTDKKFTSQRLDGTGLYYYGARYYDAEIGRFISADTIVPYPANPQAFNRYSYSLNNPLKYIDPSGNCAYLAMVQQCQTGSISLTLVNAYLAESGASPIPLPGGIDSGASDMSAVIELNNLGGTYLTITSKSNENSGLDAIFRFAWTQTYADSTSWSSVEADSASGWVLSEAFIHPGSYYYNVYLGKTAVLAPNYNYNWIGGTILVLGGSVVLVSDVVVVVGSEGWMLLTR